MVASNLFFIGQLCVQYLVRLISHACPMAMKHENCCLPSYSSHGCDIWPFISVLSACRALPPQLVKEADHYSTLAAYAPLACALATDQLFLACNYASTYGVVLGMWWEEFWYTTVWYTHVFLYSMPGPWFLGKYLYCLDFIMYHECR